MEKCEAPHEQPINRTNPEYCSCVLIPTYVCINVGPLTISILHIKLWLYRHITLLHVSNTNKSTGSLIPLSDDVSDDIKDKN